MSSKNVLPFSIKDETISVQTNFAGLGILIFLIVFSFLVGNILVILGSTFSGKKYSIKNNILRAMRVGETGNPLLMNELKNEMQKFELASGAFGLLIAIVCAFCVLWLFSWQTDVAVLGVEASSETSLSNFEALGLAVMSVVLTNFIRYSATSGLGAIDDAIETLNSNHSQ